LFWRRKVTRAGQKVSQVGQTRDNIARQRFEYRLAGKLPFLSHDKGAFEDIEVARCPAMANRATWGRQFLRQDRPARRRRPPPA
jgi:hypothetical protein